MRDYKDALIKLFKTPYYYYVYEVNKNDFFPVDRDVYLALKGSANVAPATLNKIEQLQNSGLLSCNRVQKIEDSRTEYLDYYLHERVSQIVLQVTQRCNLRCAYCIYGENAMHQRSHSDLDMSDQTAYKCIDFIREHSGDVDDISVGFYGGEPLLRFDLIKKVVAYSEQVLKGKYVRYSLTTNATLLTDEIGDFFAKHNFNMMISLDGTKEVHDSNRRFAANGKGTYDVIMKNLEQLRKRHPSYVEKINLSMVIDPENELNKNNQVVDQLRFMDIKNTTATVIDDSDSQVKNYYSENFLEENAYQRFLALLSAYGEIDLQYVYPLAGTFVKNVMRTFRYIGGIEQLPKVCNHSGPCVPGKTRPLVSVNGDIFPCERVNERAHCMCIGSVYSDFDLQRAGDQMNIGRFTEKECKSCWAIMHCGICCKEGVDGDNYSKELLLNSCLKHKRQAERNLMMALVLREISQMFHRTIREV